MPSNNTSTRGPGDDGGSMKAMIVALAVAAVVIGGYIAFALYGPEGPAISGADAGNTELVALGKTVYAENCADCHGANLQGQAADWRKPNEDGTLPAPPNDQTGHTWHHPDELLFNYTQKGGAKMAPTGFKSNMPGFGEDFGGSLTDREIWAALSFIKSRWPGEIQARQTRLNQQ